MQKRCVHCSALNDSEAMVCNHCGGDLRFAEEVYTSTASAAPYTDPPAVHEDPPPSGANTRRGDVQGSDTCHCLFPPEDTGIGICQECHRPLPGEDSPPSTSSEDPLAAEPPRRQTVIVLALPGLRPVPLGAGVLLGRDTTVVTAEIASALAPFRGVSRRHVWLVEEGDGLILIDLDSHNGTWAGANRLIPFQACRVALSVLPLTLRLGARLEVMVTLERGV